MEKQTLVLTALPNGYSPEGTARLSVFIAPRPVPTARAYVS